MRFPAVPLPAALRLCLAALLPAAALPAQNAAPQDNWTLDRVVTVAKFGAGLMYEPRWVTPLADGRIAVVEGQGRRIQIFAADGTSVNAWGTNGTGDGQFSYPTALAELQDGSLAVADRDFNRIQVFSREGVFLRKWGTTGSGDGEMNSPEGLLRLSDGNLLVCDGANGRVQVFDPNGTYLRKWSVTGRAVAAALLSDGRIALSCRNEAAVKIYNPDGTFVRQFGGWGTLDGQFSVIQGIAVLSDGKLAVVDPNNHRIQILQPDGTFVRKWGQQGSGDGSFQDPNGVAVTPDGRILVADSGNHRIQSFNAEGVFQEKFGSFGYGGDTFDQVRLIEAGGDGNFILITDSQGKPNYNLISPVGSVLQRFSFRSQYPFSVFRASSGKVYLGYYGKFDVYRADGSLELSVGSHGTVSSALGQFGGQVLIISDAVGNIYTGDVGNGRIQKFSSTGTLLMSFGEPGTGPGQLSGMQSLGISPDGSLVVALNSRLCRFDLEGRLLKTDDFSYWDSSGSGPRSIAFGLDGIQLLGGSLISPSGNWLAYNVNGYNPRTGDFYRVRGTNQIEVRRRGFRTLGANPPKLVPAPGILTTKQRANGLVDLDYVVTDGDSATVTTALVAYRGGTSLIKDLVLLRADTLVESTAAKVGAGIATGVTHRVTWNPSTAGLFSGDLVFEALARDDRPGLLDLDFITLPTTPALTISRSPLLQGDFRAVWAWLLATGDPALTRATDGEVVGPGGTFTSTSGAQTLTTASGRAWLFAKLGVREATAEEVQKARLATATSGTPNRFAPGDAQKMGGLPRALNEWTFDSGQYDGDAWWVVPLP